MKVGSLFSGIGGFDLGFERAGLSCEWQVEIDKDCQKVLKRHWPSVELFDDVTTVREFGSVDVICGGFPCQDLSVAGKRKGLAGARSGLWFEFLRIVERNRPAWIVIENVPGLFSSDEGRDIDIVLDGLEDAGYVFDVDVLDAQFHGVAQRRRRVFIVCQRADLLLKQRTLSSSLTIAQCLTESLLLVLAAAFGLSNPNSENLTFDVGRPIRSLTQRIALFGMDKAEHRSLLRENLDVLRLSSVCGQGVSEFPRGNTSLEDSRISEGTRSPELNKGTGSQGECQSTDLSWKPTLDDCLATMSECITSTGASAITESQIYSCAQLTLYIARLITRLPSSCPTYWTAALSTLTALKEFTAYARQAGNSLFTETNWIQPWRDFIGQAESASNALGSVGVECFGEVFPLSEGVSGDSPPRRKAGAGIAASLGVGAASNRSPNIGNGQGNVIEVPEIAWALQERDAKGADSDTKDGHLIVTHALSAEGADANEDGTGRGTPLVVAGHETGQGWWNESQIAGTIRAEGGNRPSRPSNIIAATLNSGGNNGGFRSEPGEHLVAFGWNKSASQTMRVDHNVTDAIQASQTSNPAIAFTERTRADGRNLESQDELAYAITNPGSGGRTHSRQIAGGFGVRRLTPRECERLQGFPDGFTRYDSEGKEISDSARYRMLGNAVAVNVSRWIGERILKVG